MANAVALQPMSDTVSKQTKKPRKGLFYVKQKDILVWERTLIIDNIYDLGTRNHGDIPEIHIGNGLDVYHDHGKILDDGVYALSSTFWVGDSGVGYSCNVEHGVARHNHDVDDQHNRLDSQALYLF